MNNKHTPGPWEAVCKGYTAPWDVKSTSVNRPQYVAGTFGMTAAEQEANARLIAAAPDLLEALELYALQYTDEELRILAETESGMGEISPTTAKREIIRRHAIAKAKGEGP